MALVVEKKKQNTCLPMQETDTGTIHGSGRSAGRGNDNPLQYSCLETPVDRGAWQATVYRVAKSWTRYMCGLISGSLFCFIDLCVCVCVCECANTIQFWLPSICNIIWNQKLWCLQLCSLFCNDYSGSLGIFHDSIWMLGCSCSISVKKCPWNFDRIALNM